MPNVVQRRVALLSEDGKFADSMTPQAVLDAVEHVDQAVADIEGNLAEMLAKSANLSDVPSPSAARTNLGAAAADHTHTPDQVTGLTTALAAKADLVGGVIPTSQIPREAMGDTVVVASQAEMLALTTAQVQPGDIAIRTDGAGSFILKDTDPSALGSWVRLNSPTDAVTSVNGQIGDVTLSAANVGAATPQQVSDAVGAVEITAAGYADQAAGSATAAADSATASATARADAVTARNEAQAAQIAAAGSASQAGAAAAAAQVAQTGAETARDTAQTAANTAASTLSSAVRIRGTLETADLNTILNFGEYYQVTAPNATAERNYPVNNAVGVLRVSNTENTVIQQFIATSGSHAGRGIYQRTYLYSSSAWSAWRFVPSQRVDTTAGRAIYTWDNLSGSEQLIYGDTGLRDVTSILTFPSVVTVGYARLSRIGQMCALSIGNMNLSEAYSGALSLGIPLGFRPSDSNVRYYNGKARIDVYSNGSGWLYDTVGSSFVYMTWVTRDAWPTTLPGTPV